MKSREDGLLAISMRQHEREVIAAYLKIHNGNVSATAPALGITRRTLETKMLLHGLRDEAGELRAKQADAGDRGAVGASALARARARAQR